LPWWLWLWPFSSGSSSSSFISQRPVSQQEEDRRVNTWQIELAAAAAAGRARQNDDSVAYPAYLKVTKDCYTLDPSPSFSGQRIIRHRDYQLYDSTNQKMTGSYALINEHLFALDTRNGRLPNSDTPGRNGVFQDRLGVANTGPFQALQTFTASVGGSAYGVPGFPDVPVFVVELNGAAYGTLNLMVTADRVAINGLEASPCR